MRARAHRQARVRISINDDLQAEDNDDGRVGMDQFNQQSTAARFLPRYVPCVIGIDTFDFPPEA